MRAAHAAVAARFGGVEVVGFHGQTLAHEPRGRGTHQVGRGDWLAREVGVPVVWDFRTADVASGGEGAPLVPFFHFACARWMGAEAPVAFLNLGGVGNVTWVDPRRAGAGGGGGAGGVRHRAGECADRRFPRACGWGGRSTRTAAVAAAGRVRRGGAGGAGGASIYCKEAAEVAGPAGFPWVPGSGGRALDRGRGGDAGGADGGLRGGGGAAFPRAGGAVAGLRRRAAEPGGDGDAGGSGRTRRWQPVEAVGLDGDMLEAQAFGYLAVRVLRGLPTSGPATTGVRLPVSGGRISRPSG